MRLCSCRDASHPLRGVLVSRTRSVCTGPTGIGSNKYANFTPFATSGAGAQGIAQFMPGTARTYGLKNPFNAAEAIDAQGRLMRDLLVRWTDLAWEIAPYGAAPPTKDLCG